MSVQIFTGEGEGFYSVPSKRLMGPTFNCREFHLGIVLDWGASFPFVRYVVVDALSATVIGAGESKAEALGQARILLRQCPRADLLDIFVQQECAANAWRREEDARLKAVTAEASDLIEKTRNRQISKKRQAVFDLNNGKCFYCEAVLEIRGGWHVEHKLPKSRGGTDLADNLVPSCAPCNYAKGTRTREEYLEQATGNKIKAVK